MTERKDTVYDLDFFDALVLVDCFDDQFVKELNLDPWDYRTRGFYGRLIDYLERFNFKRVLATDTYPVHTWLKQQYPQIELVNKIDFRARITGQRLFVAGQAWHLCLHSRNAAGFFWTHRMNTVYSSHHAVAPYHRDDTPITHLDFVNDPYAEWRKPDSKYLRRMGVWQLVNLHTPQ